MTALRVTGQTPQLFGAVHLLLLGITALASVLAVWGIRRIARPRTQTKIIQAAGWILLAIAIFQTIWAVLPGNWNIGSALPLHYSDILRFITAAALIWQFRWAAAVSYYWGLSLNSQAIVTPHPTMLVGSSIGFLLYWVLHIFVFVAPLVLVWGDRLPAAVERFLCHMGACDWLGHSHHADQRLAWHELRVRKSPA